jgi:integrase
VAALVEAPEGQEGRPSKAMTFDQALAVLQAAEESRLHGYIVVCLMTGVRTEEARALLWSHVVAWDENAEAWRPVTEAGWEHEKFAIYVWRSVRDKGETKTQRSRRSISLPRVAAEALIKEQGRQAAERERAGSKWEDHDLVFCSSAGKPLDAGNIRRKLKVVTASAGLGKDWTPRELRHTFVSLLSESGVPVEEIARLVGHTSSRTTETVYRKELRPTITAGAEVLDVRFAGTVQAGHTASPTTP